MGSESGDPDEQPVHPVELSAYWLSETPISWAVYCELMDWEPPPKFLKMDFPRQKGKIYKPAFLLNEEHKIRLQYCQDKTIRAVDWHAHVPPENGLSSHFGSPPEDPTIPEQYNSKPMVCISWQSAEELCQQISNEKLLYRLPTEAEWEKAARGGLINSRYPWGDEPPTHELCDFNRFDRFSILPMKKFAPNSYGLYSMSGCIWEWTSDYYDAEYYRESPKLNPLCLTGQQRVLRGGSWADCADAVTVSVRMSRSSSSWRDGNTRFRNGHYTPNIGFRLCRIVKCQVSEP
jgi:formylglycine-generating enzyme required for sulfatase activity